MKTFKYIIVSVVFPILTFGQVQSELYLVNGKVIQGNIVLIGDDYILYQEANELITISRDSIHYQLSTGNHGLKRTKSPRIPLTPISKRFTSEVDAGITFAMPFALRMGYSRWANLGKHWQLGLGATMQFYRYTMFSGHAGFRYNLGQSRFAKPFFEGGFGLSYLTYVNGLNFRSSTGVNEFPFGYKADFNPVKQVLFGPGMYIDSGLGVGFTTKLQYNATWYKLNENPKPDFEIRGEYFFSSVSVLFGFIF